MKTYKIGYVPANVFAVCATCHKIRHGLTKVQVVSLAARTVVYCKLAVACFGDRYAKYTRAAEKILRARVWSSQPCLRAHSTNYNTYRCSAKKRCATAQGKRCPSSVFMLTRKQFNDIRQNACFYCGLENANGIDRLYPAIGYTESNSVPCCMTCNYAKNDMHPAAYITHMATIVHGNVITRPD